MRKFFWASMIVFGMSAADIWPDLSFAQRHVALAVARDQFYASPE